MSDHGLDLAALQAHGHSIFGPSSSAMWLFCSGSLIPNITAPDTAGEDAAYGTVGHEVGETWLRNYGFAKERFGGPADMLVDMAMPKDMLGTVQTVQERNAAYEIEIDEEMLAHVRKYVDWCVQDEGDHFVEVKTDHSDLTPIPQQGGRSDFACCTWQKLKIKDLKMGLGVRVFAKDNTQGLLYAYGFFRAYDWLYDFQEIEIGIAQPRLDHFDTWTVSRAELLEFAAWAKVRAHAAWAADAPRSPSPKACQWCKVKSDCAALATWLQDATADAFDDLDGETIEGEFYVVEQEKMLAVRQQIDEGWAPNPKDPARLPTATLEKLLPYRKLVEKWFAEIEGELLARATDGEELTKWKLVPGRSGHRKYTDEDAAENLLTEHGVPRDEMFVTKMVSPATAETLLRTHGGFKKKEAAQLLDSVTAKPPSRQTLAPISDEREALGAPADAFDNLDEEL